MLKNRFLVSCVGQRGGISTRTGYSNSEVAIQHSGVEGMIRVSGYLDEKGAPCVAVEAIGPARDEPAERKALYAGPLADCLKRSEGEAEVEAAARNFLDVLAEMTTEEFSRGADREARLRLARALGLSEAAYGL